MEADAQEQQVRDLRAENERLRREAEELRRELEKLREENRRLVDRIDELERAAVRQAAPFRRPEKKRKPSDQKRRPGRPRGHPPAYRQQPTHVDAHVEVPLICCPHCGGPVSGVHRCRQLVEEPPPTQSFVTELVTHVGTCARCGEVRSTHPLQVSTANGAAGTHLGPRALAMAAYLHRELNIPARPTCRILQALCGLTITPGGLSQAMHRVADKVEGSYQELIRGLREQPAVYSDETSWWLAGEQAWLWGFTTEERTVYRVETGRGRDVVLDTLGPAFGGVLVSDCLAVYENLPYRVHKCYAHHMKAIAGAAKGRSAEARAFLDELAGLLRAALVIGRIRHDIPPGQFAWARARLDQRADELLGPDRPDPDEQRVINRLRKRRHCLFTFLDQPGVDATNNRAERALRPAVVARKLSCGNKTTRGKRTWEILHSLAVTCRQRGESFIDWLCPRIGLAMPIRV